MAPSPEWCRQTSSASSEMGSLGPSPSWHQLLDTDAIPRSRTSSSPAGAATISEFTSSGAAPGGENERSHFRALVRTRQSTAGSSMLTGLCEVAVDELRMSGAAVSLMTPVLTGRDQPGTIAAASGDRARSIEELEFGLGEG